MFQSQQHEDDFGINMYSFRWREHDPTIGRFWQIDPLADKYVYNSPYAFSENKVVNSRELEGLEAQRIIDDAWREVEANFNNLADAVDNFFSFTKEEEVKTTTSKGGYTSVKKTTDVSTTFGESMRYIEANNSNEGNPTSLFSSKSETDVSVGQEVSPKYGIIKGKGSVSVNQQGVVTTQGEMSAKGKKPVDFTAGGSYSTDGTATVKAGASVSSMSGNTTVNGEVNVEVTPNNISIQPGIGIDQKMGKTEVSEKFYKKIDVPIGN